MGEFVGGRREGERGGRGGGEGGGEWGIEQGSSWEFESEFESEFEFEFEFVGARQQDGGRGEASEQGTDNRRARINSGSQTGWLAAPAPTSSPQSCFARNTLSSDAWLARASLPCSQTHAITPRLKGRTRILGCSRGDKLRPPRPHPVGVVSKSQGPALKQHHTSPHITTHQHPSKTAPARRERRKEVGSWHWKLQPFTGCFSVHRSMNQVMARLTLSLPLSPVCAWFHPHAQPEAYPID